MFRTPKIFVFFFVSGAIGLASLVRFYQVGHLTGKNFGQLDMASSAIEDCPDEKLTPLENCQVAAKESEDQKLFSDEVFEAAKAANLPLKLLHAMLGTFQMAHEKFEVDLEGLYQSFNNIQQPLREAQHDYDRLRATVEEKFYGRESDFRKLESLGGVTPSERAKVREAFLGAFKSGAAKELNELQLAKKLHAKEMQMFSEKVISILTERLNLDFQQVIRKLVTRARNSGSKGAVIIFAVYLEQRIRRIQQVQEEAEQRKVSEDRSSLMLISLEDLNSESAFASKAVMRCPADEYKDVDSSVGQEVPHRESCQRGPPIDAMKSTYRDFLRACHRRGQGSRQCQ